MQKRVTISIDEEVNERWTKVAKKLELSKSGMVEDFVLQILPILEQKEPSKMMQQAFKQMGEQIELTGSLFNEK